MSTDTPDYHRELEKKREEKRIQKLRFEQELR